jgi:hypothetical protein
MPARQPRLPVTAVAQIPRFRLSSDAWARLEKVYRRSIPIDVRDRLEGATINYLRLAEMERKAPPQASARDEISATRKAADALLQRLQAIQGAATDVHSFIRHLIAQRLKLEKRGALSDQIKDLVRALRLLSSVLSELDANGAHKAALFETRGAHVERDGAKVPMPCETAKKYASTLYKTKMAALRAFGTQQEGDAWRTWIRQLRNILREAGLPAGVSKSSAGYPLFRFVNALNEELPKDRRKLSDSLADAIYDAIHD